MGHLLYLIGFPWQPTWPTLDLILVTVNVTHLPDQGLNEILLPIIHVALLSVPELDLHPFTENFNAIHFRVVA